MSDTEYLEGSLEDLDSDVDMDNLELEMMIDHEDPLFNMVRGHMIDLYIGTSQNAKDTASWAHQWLRDLFRNVPRYDTFWTEQAVGDQPNEFVIVSNGQHICSLLPPVTELYNIDGLEVWGMEMLLAIAISLNDKLGAAVDWGVENNSVLSIDHLRDLANPGARESVAVGVYTLISKNNKYIIGHAISQGFRGRLGSKTYSKAAKVVDELGEADGIVDQRIGRQDLILFNLQPLEDTVESLRWLAQGLESLSIILFDSTNPLTGMNSNIGDSSWHYEGLTPTQLKKFWDLIREVTANGHSIPTREGSDLTTGKANFYEFHAQHLKMHSATPKRLAPVTLIKLIHKISPLADTGLFRSFEPLNENAFMFRRPKMRGIKASMFRRPEQPEERFKRQLNNDILDPAHSAWLDSKRDYVYTETMVEFEGIILDGATLKARDVRNQKKVMAVVSEAAEAEVGSESREESPEIIQVDD